MILPPIIGGGIEEPNIDYILMWRNFLGHHYLLPLETPKPLFVLLNGILGPRMLYPAMSLFTAGVLGLLMKMASHLNVSRYLGAAGFLLFLTSSLTVLPEFILPAYWPMFYYFLILGSLYTFMKKRPVASSLFLLAAGLVRPEAWLYSPILMLISKFRKQYGFSFWYLMPLLAPVLWVLFDYRISGDFFFSSKITNYYGSTLGLKPATFWNYWPGCIGNVLLTYNGIPLMLGLLGLVGITIRTRGPAHLLLAISAAEHLFFFWVLCSLNPTIIHVRYLSYSLLILCFYAAIVIGSFLKKHPVVMAAAMTLLIAATCKRNLPEVLCRVTAGNAATRNNCASLLQPMERYGARADVILTGRSAGYFLLHLPEIYSRKILSFRQMNDDPSLLQNVQSGLVVYLKNDQAFADSYYSFLADKAVYRIGAFECIPVYDTNDAHAILYRLVRIFPETAGYPMPVQGAYTRAMILLNKDSSFAATQLFEKMCVDYPDCPLPRGRLYSLYQKLGRRKDADSLLQIIYRDKDSLPRDTATRIFSYYHNGIEDLFNRAARNGDDNQTLNALVATFKAYVKNPRAILQQSRPGELSDEFSNLVERLLTQKRLGMADTVCSLMRTFCPVSDYGGYLQADIMVASGRFDSGLAICDSLIRKNPGQPALYILAAKALVGKGDRPSALRVLKTGIGSVSDVEGRNTLLAMLHQLEGQDSGRRL